MAGGVALDGERRRYLRIDIRLPLQFFASSSTTRPAKCETLNVSLGGFLVRGRGVGQLCPGELIRAHMGLPADVWHDTDQPFRVRVKRAEKGMLSSCAVEVVGPPPSFLFAPEFVGKHPSMLEVKTKLADIADYNVNVLILGESGTGKNVVAEVIHRYSCRSEFPFVRVNCPSIPDTLLESQLFGHDKGAFTDAKSARPGVFRLSRRGTLVLDEISAIPCGLQAKLLQAIEEKKFIPVGAKEAVKVDVRIIATTNDNLERRMREGGFRKDLFYRLNEVPLTVPPLRDRKNDIPLLMDYFLRKYCSEFGKEYQPLGRLQMEMFQSYSWPGNVRELENVIKRRILMGQLELPRLDSQERSPVADCSGSAEWPTKTTAQLSTQMEEAEKLAVIHALEAANHNKTRAAAELGISYRTLLRKIKKYESEA